jgi:hypothetical protein
LVFIALTPAELAQVRIPVATAEQVALAIPPQGYGPAGATVVWKRVGCIYLGWYRAPLMPSVGYVPRRFPAYLVEVIGDPVKGWPEINVAAVVVNAQTGAPVTTYGNSASPGMGTTCGVPS